MRNLFRFAVALLAYCMQTAVATNDSLINGAVTWDQFSLMIRGSRVFINAGEFHYARLPVPELWLDIFQKFKANGFNTVSIYFFWSYHSAAKGVFDFHSGGKNLTALFQAAKDAGLWVIARAGPYCNAETNAGGLALWGSDGSMGRLRTNDATYYESWLPWVQQIGTIIAGNSIANGGPVILNQIENELQETQHVNTSSSVVYMEELESAFRDAGVAIPFTSNEKGMRYQSWSTDYEDVGGAVDVYGLDSYPVGASCTNPGSGFKVVRAYFGWFSNYSYSQPSYLAEFEGGWFSGWGSTNFYDQCLSEHSPSLPDLFYKNNIAQRVTLQSFYMTYGGTNWGHLAAPVVYTSYDYSAGIRETRQQWDKLFQTKLVNLFAASSPDLLKTYMYGNGTGYRVSSTSGFTWVLKNPDTNATFTTLQQTNTSSETPVTVDVYLDTSIGLVAASNVTLNGRQSKILVTDYPLHSHAMLYVSSDVLTWATFDDDDDCLVLYLQKGQFGQFAFRDEKHLGYEAYGDSPVSVANNGTQQIFGWTQELGSTAVRFSNGLLVYLLEQQTAWTFWAPSTSADVYGSPSEKIFIIGPYLVRSAHIHGRVLYVSGDNDKSITLEAYVGRHVAIRTIVWNGIHLSASRTKYGAYRVEIPGAESRSVSLPVLTRWVSADSIPEARPEYDDSNWTVCNKTSSLSPVAPYTLPVLFSSDYGFYAGAKVYRGRFEGVNATAVNITCSGGLAFGWNAWVNGQLIGGNAGDPRLATTTDVLSIPSSVLNETGNVLTVLVDYHGHDQTSTARGSENPRGILGAMLLPYGTARETGFTSWGIQGNAGGSANIDPVRGPMNEGGLYGERLGWHLPGFLPRSDDVFDSSTPFDGLSAAGVRFYMTNFTLDIDADLDAPLGVSISSPQGTVARVMFWINGYQYGKYEPHIGPQTVFPVPPGVVNNRGVNTMALSLWAQTEAGARLDGIELVTYGLYQTGFAFGRDWSALQPGWTNRTQYA